MMRMSTGGRLGSPRRRVGRAAEVIYHQSPLLRRQLLQFFPRGNSESLIVAHQSGLQGGGQVDAVVCCRSALPLLLLIFFPALQRAAGIEHAAEQSLLAVDHLPVESSGFQTPRQILGLFRHLPRSWDVAFSPNSLQLLSQGALPGSQP